MRQDNLEFPQPPGGDRPSDAWMDEQIDGRQTRVLTWSGTRRRWTLIALSISIAGAFIAWMVVPSATLMKPGELASPHAQILAGSLDDRRCAACHTAASLSLAAWLKSAGDAHPMVTQNDLCMDCHHRTIPRNLATTAHNLSQSVRDELTASVRLASRHSTAKDDSLPVSITPPTAVDQANVDCATCHREHHGSNGDLLSMTNSQCQTCHAEQFGSFASSHPAWSDWPYRRGGDIAFNHVTHSGKHFPSTGKKGTQFECSLCHRVAQNNQNPWIKQGEISRVESFEHSCAGCHEESLRLQLGKGVDFVALPIIDEEVARRLPGWPDLATGPTEGTIPPLTELLLRTDPEFARTMRELPGRSLTQLPPDNQSVEKLHHIAQAVQNLIVQSGRQGHAYLEQKLIERGLSPTSFAPVLHSLPPQLIESASRWFEKDASVSTPVTERQNTLDRPLRLVLADDSDLLGEASLLGDDNVEADLLTDDPLAEDPLLDSNEQPPAGSQANRIAMASEIVTRGGWYREDLEFAIRYRPVRHADPVLVGLIGTFAQLSRSDPLRTRFFETSAVKSCLECHRGATDLISNWQSRPLIGRRDSFTKFSHGPHLSMSQLGSCVHCHRLATDAVTTVNLESNALEFEPLTRESCAACHTKQAAGENCTTCHRYHVGL